MDPEEFPEEVLFDFLLTSDSENETQTTSASADPLKEIICKHNGIWRGDL